MASLSTPPHQITTMIPSETPSKGGYVAIDQSFRNKRNPKKASKAIKECRKQPENDHPNKVSASMSPPSPPVIRTKTLSDPFVDLRDAADSVDAIFLKQDELDNERIDRADRQDRLDAMWEEEMKEREEGYKLAALDLRVERELQAVREMIKEYEMEGKATTGLAK